MTRWVLLTYRLPREPSTPRIALWRQLRRLGVAQLGDGVVALPLDARTREQLEWLAESVEEQGGEATIWIAESGTRAQERSIAQRLSDTVAAEYEQVIADAAAAEVSGDVQRRTAARLRREIQRIGSRDYFPPTARARARTAVAVLTKRVSAAS
jgi:hypothetical protein